MRVKLLCKKKVLMYFMQAINKEAVTVRCSVKRLFLKISQNLHENSGLQLY